MKRKAEIIGSILFVLFAGGFFWLTLGLRPSPGPDVGGAFYPRILIFFTLVLSLKLLITSIIDKDTDKQIIFDLKEGGLKRVILVIIISLIYLYVLETVGFLVLTPIYLFVLLSIIDAKKIPIRIVISIVTVGVIWFLFQNFLNIPFPSGILG